MKRSLLLFLFVVFGIKQAFGQRDTEHWLPPFFLSTTGYSQALFLSTDSTVPFDVRVYNNNTLLTTITNLSKGNPRSWTITGADVSHVYTSTTGDAMRVINKGLHLVGDRPFMANIRIGQPAHAEFFTLKGKAALGTEFRVVTTPTATSTTNNFTAGILASEDNTTVTVSGYQSNVVFINGGAVAPSSYTFVLNKGQSFIFAGNAAGMSTGFIGAKIVSNKPVAVVNGNANGNFGAGTGASGSDLIMDETVPINRLGQEFAMVRSLSPLNTSNNMEGAIVVAAHDNTEIYVNGGTTPVATINDGQYYRIPESSFVNQGNAHYNMRVYTTQPAYVYQLVGMQDTYSGGFNYIPPLNCYLPRTIDEIGNIDVMPSSSGAITMKLNIITQPGATLQVTSNGNVITPLGPFNINGTTEWVTYSATGITGNVVVTSDRAVTAGVNGGYSTAGYGGYFAGASNKPSIDIVNGECIPGVTLGVPNIYQQYQWYLNGAPISGANGNTYVPTAPGEYTIVVTIDGCLSVESEPLKVYNCTYESTQDFIVCNEVTSIPVQFSQSTETVDPSTIEILTAPANGTAVVNTFMNQIIYTPNGTAGADTFTYKFKSTIPEYGDVEIVTVNINNIVLETTNGNLSSCPYNGIANFDLTSVTVTTHPGATNKYYRTLLDAQQDVNAITVPASYDSAEGIVYVRVTTPEGCFKIAEIELIHAVQPVFRDASLTSCFIEENPTSALFDLTTADIGAGANFVKVFFASLADAEANRNPIATPEAYISPSTYVYVRAYNAIGCYNIAKIELIVTPPKYSEILKDVVICLEDRTTLDAGSGFTSYLWSTGATTSSISDVKVGEYWVLLESDNCFTRQRVRVIKAPEAVINNVEITNNEATITVTGGTPPYQYSVDGVVWQDSNVLKALKRGTNVFYVKDSYDCSPITTTVVIPNLINAITPNGDGVNDVLDYSELANLDGLSFVIYDRYGAKIFEGNKQNGFVWDGRASGKKVSTGNYWYTIHWNSGTSTTMKYNGWIMVKNLE